MTARTNEWLNESINEWMVNGPEGRSRAGSDPWPGNRADRPGQPAPVDRPVDQPIWPAGCPVDRLSDLVCEQQVPDPQVPQK